MFKIVIFLKWKMQVKCKNLTGRRGGGTNKLIFF